MSYVISLLEQYGLAVIFANVLLGQAGLPLPVYPTLIFAGAIMGGGTHSMTDLVVIAVLAAMTADSLWYIAGRRFGTSVLRNLCRISFTPEACIGRTTHTFRRYGAPSLLIAKFVPGFAAISGALSGAIRINYLKFLLFDLLGSVLWVAIPIGLGYQFRSAINGILQRAAILGEDALIIGVIALGTWLFYIWWARHRLGRQIQMNRISIEQLQQLMREGKANAILDVRGAADQSPSSRIPGARPIQFDRIDDGVSDLAPTDEIVVYCSCPNDAGAVTVAKELLQRGFQKVHPLSGGIDAWTAAGLPVESGFASAH